MNVGNLPEKRTHAPDTCPSTQIAVGFVEVFEIGTVENVRKKRPFKVGLLLCLNDFSWEEVV